MSRNVSLRWRHNGCDGVSNHLPHGCLLNLLFGRRSKWTSKLRLTGLCVGNSPESGAWTNGPTNNRDLRPAHYGVIVMTCPLPNILDISQSHKIRYWTQYYNFVKTLNSQMTPHIAPSCCSLFADTVKIETLAGVIAWKHFPDLTPFTWIPLVTYGFPLPFFKEAILYFIETPWRAEDDAVISQ